MKERLTGAIILVVLIVLLVPELLSGPSRPVAAPRAAATSSEEPPLRSYTIDLTDESHAAASSVSSTANPSPQVSGPTQPPTIVEPPPNGVPPPASVDSSSAGALPQAQDGPVQAGTEEAQQPPRAALSQPLPQRTPSPAQRSETPAAGGWMVQLGVFAKHENADRLVQELKAQGFHALVSESSGGGRTLWRVRAGPAAERAAAEQLSARLRAAGHTGSVVPK